jgi:hypothetical protein
MASSCVSFSAGLNGRTELLSEGAPEEDMVALLYPNQSAALRTVPSPDVRRQFQCHYPKWNQAFLISLSLALLKSFHFGYLKSSLVLGEGLPEDNQTTSKGKKKKISKI